MTQLTAFATRYAAAWSSQNPASLASFYAENGSLTVNTGTPSVGRAAITATAQGFMTAFPDMVVKMDREGGHITPFVRSDYLRVERRAKPGTSSGQEPETLRFLNSRREPGRKSSLWL